MQLMHARATRNAGDAHYVITFNENNKPAGQTVIVSTGKTDLSTEYDPDTHTIIANPKFDGWHNLARNEDGTKQLNDVKLGNSGTDITVTPNISDGTSYEVKGDVGKATMTSSDRHLTIYPHWLPVTIKLPDATRDARPRDDDGNLIDDENGSDPDKFIGWFTKPQPEEGGSGDGGEYIGGPGEEVTVATDMELYPWFNIAPVIVHGKIKDGFYEGQKVSYDQLLTLVDAWDRDNPKDPAGMITYDGSEAWIKLYQLQAESFLMNELGYTEEQANKILAQHNYDNFKPVVSEIIYYGKDNIPDPNPDRIGLDDRGNIYPQSGKDDITDASVISKGLDTTRNRVGYVDIIYKITDNGVYDGLTQIMIANGYDVDSTISVYYTMNSVIRFNYNPMLDLTNASYFSTDKALNKDTIIDFIFKKQDPKDKCDDVDNIPWWAKSDKDADGNPYVDDDGNSSVFNTETERKLNESLKVISVYDIRFNPGYEAEHPTECEAIRAGATNLTKLWEYKTSDYETFKHIISYKVEFDCIDQWGKTASGLIYDEAEIWDKDHPELEHGPGTKPPYDPGKPGHPDEPLYGLSREERSIIVVPFNNEDDADLVLANAVVSERMRYIDEFFTVYKDTLGGNSFWGNGTFGGRGALMNVFDTYKAQHPEDEKTAKPDPTIKGTGEFTTDSGNTVNITVNDFTK